MSEQSLSVQNYCNGTLSVSVNYVSCVCQTEELSAIKGSQSMYSSLTKGAKICRCCYQESNLGSFDHLDTSQTQYHCAIAALRVNEANKVPLISYLHLFKQSPTITFIKKRM